MGCLTVCGVRGIMMNSWEVRFLADAVFCPVDSEADQLRFSDIYSNYQKQMLLVAKRILHSDEDAEDAVQIAFLGIAQRIKSLPVMIGVYGLMYLPQPKTLHYRCFRRRNGRTICLTLMSFQ